MGVIYRFVFPNGKMYIGQTKQDVEKRWAVHRARASHSWYLANAIRKYGWDSIKKEVLVEVPNDCLDEYEMTFIDTFNTFGEGGYNLTPGGDFNPMATQDGRDRHLKALQSQGHRELMQKRTREWHKDKVKHEAWREKNTAAQRRPDVRARAGARVKARWEDAGMREKMMSAKAASREAILAKLPPSEARKRRKVMEARSKRALHRIPSGERVQARMERVHAAREARLALLPEAERDKKRKRMERDAERACIERAKEGEEVKERRKQKVIARQKVKQANMRDEDELEAEMDAEIQSMKAAGCCECGA
jgi:group I intron endonuclease